MPAIWANLPKGRATAASPLIDCAENLNLPVNSPRNACLLGADRSETVMGDRRTRETNMRTIAIVFVATVIGWMIAGPPAAARPGGGHGKGAGNAHGAHSFAGPMDGHPTWENGNPPGFSMGGKSGWDDGVPPGWHKGQKKGWKGRSLPPGLYRR